MFRLCQHSTSHWGTAPCKMALDATRVASFLAFAVVLLIARALGKVSLRAHLSTAA